MENYFGLMTAFLTGHEFREGVVIVFTGHWQIPAVDAYLPKYHKSAKEKIQQCMSSVEASFNFYHITL